MDDLHPGSPRGRFSWPRGQQAELIALDAFVAACYTAVTIVVTIDAGAPGPPRTGDPAWLVVLVVSGMGLPLAVRRLWPLPVLCVVLALSVVAELLHLIRDPFVAAATALYAVGLMGGRRWWAPALAIGGIVGASVLDALLTGGLDRWARDLSWTLLGIVVAGGGWTLGRAARDRRAYRHAHGRRATEQALTDERLRIARELHDVVAHSMSLIVVKAGVANHVMRERPEEAYDALRVIEAASRGALIELRHLLGVLRTGADTTEAPDPLAPAPGIAALAELTERAAMAGVRVEMDVRDADHLPEGLGLSVYRIVQEALTNVVKHAAPARCRVSVEASGAEVRIDVSDDGPGRQTAPGGGAAALGHGLVGMRERVAMYGGAFTAGPGRDGGFAVSARLPYREETP
jgi:signal transduction histidine kinase